MKSNLQSFHSVVIYDIKVVYLIDHCKKDSIQLDKSLTTTGSMHCKGTIFSIANEWYLSLENKRYSERKYFIIERLPHHFNFSLISSFEYMSWRLSYFGPPWGSTFIFASFWGNYFYFIFTWATYLSLVRGQRCLEKALFASVGSFNLFCRRFYPFLTEIKYRNFVEINPTVI